MKYKVIKAETLDALEENVNKHIESGWKAQGGVEIKSSSRSYLGYFFQAIIKE